MTLDADIQLVVPAYDPFYQAKLALYAEEKEGGKRCYLCYKLRLEEAYRYAQREHFAYFTTVMTISNHKNAAYLNQIGIELEKKYQSVKYLVSDFKKSGGIELNRQLNQQLQLYEQPYCGCIYSLKAYQSTKNS